MFYSEEALIQQAIQNSLVHNHGEENLDAMYKQAMDQALVDSKKEHDDVFRKQKEAEISAIKDKPEELQKKTAEILSKGSPSKLAPLNKPKLDPIKPAKVESPVKTIVEKPTETEFI